MLTPLQARPYPMTTSRHPFRISPRMPPSRCPRRRRPSRFLSIGRATPRTNWGMLGERPVGGLARSRERTT